MNQLQAFLVALLSSKYSKLFTGIVGTVATLYWLPQILQTGHPVVAQDIGMLVTGATALFAFLQSSPIGSVNAAANAAATNPAPKPEKPATPPPLPVLFALAVTFVVGLIGLVVSCTQQQAKTAETIAVDITNAICSPADPLDANPIVAVVCTVAQTGESVAGTVTSLTIKMPKEQVPGFVAAHSHATSDANITVTVTTAEAGKQ